MMASEGLSRNQERFLQGLLLGKSIVESAKFAGVSEPTATRWMRNPLIQEARFAREAALAEKEQAEIERILTSGYAAIHNRVQALNQMARDLEKPYISKNGREYNLEDNPEKVREWRACLDDIAKELGQRVKKADVTSAGEKMASQQVVFYLPEVDEEAPDGNDA